MDAIRNDTIVRCAAATVLAILAGVGWLLFSQDLGSADLPYTHMHCPACLEECPYSARLAGTECPNCANGAKYVPTVGSIADGSSGPGLGGKIVIFVMLTLVLVPSFALVAVHRIKALREKEEEECNRILVCHCPYCQRKIGFRVRDTGSGRVCPRCKTAFVLQ